MVKERKVTKIYLDELVCFYFFFFFYHRNLC